jgi:CelD/BcsL family acetyltransferase involved in cellulose biosynthesis
MRMMRQLDFEILPEVGGLETEWWELWRRAAEASPFQSPAWLLPWREQFREGDSVILAGRRQDGSLAALLPLFRHRGRLLPWGAGTSDWLDGVFDPDIDLAELADGLARLNEPPDLFQLPASSPLLRMPCPAGWTEVRRPAETCVSLLLPVKLSANMAQNLRTYRNRAERAGIGEPKESGADAFDDLVRLHELRWAARDKPGIFADPRMLAWQRKAAAELERTGMLRLYTLSLGRKVVAAAYVLSAKQRAYYYIGGFDPKHEKLGLGTLLIGHAIAEAEREGAQGFDFLRGQESYKYRWGGEDVTAHTRLLIPSKV